MVVDFLFHSYFIGIIYHVSCNIRFRVLNFQGLVVPVKNVKIGIQGTNMNQ